MHILVDLRARTCYLLNLDNLYYLVVQQEVLMPFRSHRLSTQVLESPLARTLALPHVVTLWVDSDGLSVYSADVGTSGTKADGFGRANARPLYSIGFNRIKRFGALSDGAS